MNIKEQSLRDLIRDPERFSPDFVSFCEYGRGGDPGLPDTWFMMSPIWVPIELKRGKQGCSGFRTTQRRWHKNCALYGVPTFCLAWDGFKIRLFRIDIGKGSRGRTSGLQDYLLGTCSEEEFNMGWVTSHIRPEYVKEGLIK